MDRLQELKDLVASFEKDFVKFYEKGNKSAGTRVRKHMNELKRKAQEIRKEVQERKAARMHGGDDPKGRCRPARSSAAMVCSRPAGRVG